MITSYKESIAKEELNKKTCKTWPPQKTPHLCFMPRTTHCYLHTTVTIELVFDEVCFESR